LHRDNELQEARVSRQRGRIKLGGALVAAAAAALALPAAAGADVSTTVIAGSLTTSSDAGDRIAIDCVDGNVKVNGEDPGEVLACADLRGFSVFGGPDANTIDLRGITAEEFPLLVDGGTRRSFGRGGDDTMLGSEVREGLLGNEGDDRLTAFKGDDAPTGGDGNDTIVWNNGDGSDEIEGEAGSDTVEVVGGDGDEEFTVAPSAETPGRVAFDRVDPAPFNLDIGTAELLRLNANDGNDRIKGADGLAELIKSSLGGGPGDDRVRGTDGADVLLGNEGNDVIRSRDEIEDQVDCDGVPRGEEPGPDDSARVDRLDSVQNCELVRGGRQRVKVAGKRAEVTDRAAELRLKCVAADACKGALKLRRGGKTLGKKRFKMSAGNAKTVRVKLSGTGRRLVARGSVRAKAEIDARDSDGNGWRSSSRVKLKT
jgi:RTX calcium-binding nonapeptide repeat (4 copies)